MSEWPAIIYSKYQRPALPGNIIYVLYFQRQPFANVRKSTALLSWNCLLFVQMVVANIGNVQEEKTIPELTGHG